jgi:hypothetical protein
MAYMLTLFQYPNTFTIAMCFQAFEWCISMLDRGAEQLDQFEDENEFKLCERDADRLCQFLLSDSFTPLLTALDTDQARVEERELRATLTRDLKERLHSMGTRQLSLWLGGDLAQYDEEDYNDTAYPMHPLPAGDWVMLQQTLMPQGEEAEDILPRSINNLARYVHCMHYKVDRMLELLRAKHGDGSEQVRNWEELVNKFPFLAACDDHVRHTPNPPPLLLSRTSAVTHHACLCLFHAIRVVCLHLSYYVCFLSCFPLSLVLNPRRAMARNSWLCGASGTSVGLCSGPSTSLQLLGGTTTPSIAWTTASRSTSSTTWPDRRPAGRHRPQ